MRTAGIKVIASTEFTQTVISAAAFLTINAQAILCASDQPTVESMRASLLPAYQCIADSLGELLNIDINKEDLYQLSVDMYPTLGTYTVHVTHQTQDVRQPYKIKVAAADGKNTFLRLLAMKDADYAQDFISKI